MTRTIAESIQRGLEEAVAYADGKADLNKFVVNIPQEVDVKAIRARLGMKGPRIAGDVMIYLRRRSLAR